MKTIIQIQQRYPAPEACSDQKPSYFTYGYCVGGALLMALDEGCRLGPYACEQRFPSEDQRAAVLRQYNPQLTEGQAYHCALGIIGANDQEQFDVAWERAHTALIYQR